MVDIYAFDHDSQNRTSAVYRGPNTVSRIHTLVSNSRGTALSFSYRPATPKVVEDALYEAPCRECDRFDFSPIVQSSVHSNK